MSAEVRCFFCQYLDGAGHGKLCPIGWPTKHRNKMIWWAGHHAGLAGKPLDVRGYADPDDRARFTMGWTVGAEAIAPLHKVG